MASLTDRRKRRLVDAIINGASIKGLTGLLAAVKGEAWLNLLERLRKFKLIAPKSEHRPDTLDCHPLIHEHFGEKLKKQNPEGWKEAHSRLYEYYKNLPEKLYGKELPDTLEEMEPLFAAVKHGCLAGRVQEAGDDVYWKRIKRKDEQYIYHKLGAFGAALACLSNFFESPWDRLADRLTEHDKATVLSWTGYALRAVGRLREAIQPMKACLKLYESDNAEKDVAIAANNLSELQLTLGDIKEALHKAEQSVTFADRSGDDSIKEAFRTTLAEALFHAGKTEKAERFFIEAEKRQKKRWSESPYLFSLWGYRYCDLLISSGRHAETLKRAETILEYKNEGWYSLLCIALDNLSIGRALMLQSVQDPSALLRINLSEAEKFLNLAVDGLRGAGHQSYLSRGLLARSALYRYQENFSKSWTDLDEAREIAEYGEMKLHLVDYYLEWARCIKMQGS